MIADAVAVRMGEKNHERIMGTAPLMGGIFLLRFAHVSAECYGEAQWGHECIVDN
jgi:hypothetical protein